ncbi:MAG: fibronectin type III domain-containing protein [Ruminococcus sp.]|nr:fibronectin type III domain-containing protein [Ruminococcus sp.]
MKKLNLKKKTAFLMALSLTSGYTGITGFAAEVLTDNNSNSTERSADIKYTGEIDITVGSALYMNAVEITFELTGADGFSEKRTARAGADTGKARFSSLPDGEYTLTAKADGFADYVQNISVAGNMYSLTITTGLASNTSYKEGDLHNGAMLIGDVDRDGDIDDDDKDKILYAIRTQTESDELTTDLNRDGKTDLLDLDFFSKGYKSDKHTLATIEESVSPATVTATVMNNTKLEGSVEKMLCGTEEITLSPANPDAPISAENPIGLEFEVNADVAVDGITLATGEETKIEEGEIDVTYIEDGEENTIQIPVKKDIHFLLKESEAYASIDSHGNIQVHLGGKVAVKKVAITVTSMADKANIAKISEVKFVNDMASRIPEPEIDKPTQLKTVAGSEKFSLSWKPCMNVTGYEVKIEDGKNVETILVSTNTLDVTSFNNGDVKNFTTYKVSVQSVNGTWKSGYCDSVDVTPKPTKRPDKPDGVKATGIFKGVKVSWQDFEGATEYYEVYYKVRNSEDEYKKISDIKGTSYTISDLDSVTEYEVYVIGVNELGSSPASVHAVAKTTDLNPAEMPKYNVINRDENGVIGSSHIIDVKRYGGYMVDSKVDDEEDESTAWATVDGDPLSYYEKSGYNDGGWSAVGNNGLTYTFDKEYTFNTIGILTTTFGIGYTHFRWWDEDGTEHRLGQNWDYMNYSSRRTDSAGRPYYVITLPETITTSKFQFGLGAYGAPCVNVAEVYFYEDNGLMSEIMGLYIDDLHTVLRDDVTQEMIDELREKAVATDEFGYRNELQEASLLRELDTAEKILKEESLSKPVTVHNGITTKDANRGFSGINAWQPLGVTVGGDEEITVYIGSDKKKTGESTNLSVIATQYHSESNGVVLKEFSNLKIGANTLKVPKGSLSQQENGGALYVQYSGNSGASERYSVRVTGGTKVPFLDLYKVTDEQERMNRAVEYITALDEYVPTIEALHNTKHSGSGNSSIDMDFDEANCILGVSDIMLDTMMYSLPAKQLLSGMGSGTVEERAETLLRSMQSTEEMMYLFYQHKGLNANAKDEINQIPKGHQNIRYQRMFSGAFMYASGNHIGIEWGSVPSMVKSTSVQADEDGKYVSGSYFGWGIAHEIGHCINQGTYSVAEITNNYFAQLAQAQDKNEGMRFQYSNIYSKVTSGTKGSCPNIATQLGMYWQLHLAYDSGMNFKTYSDYNEQLANIFYARVDTYSRNTNLAPSPDGIKLTLGNVTDQNLMRLACAASEKNVLEFFERWGKTPDDTTREYASQFPKETRAIYFANDDSRVYALKGGESVLGTDGDVKAIKDVEVTKGKASNQIKLDFTSCDIPESDILGYEIERCIISGGDVQSVPVGFSTSGSFTDTVSTLNNRTVFYRVTLIDQYLNRSAVFETKQVKISHDGSMDKTNWSVSVNGFEENKETVHATEETSSCQAVLTTPEMNIIDFDLDTVYTPHIENEKAELIISFNQVLTTTGLKYTAGEGHAIEDYEIYVYEEDDWTLVSQGKFNGSKTVYFANDDGKYISTYDTTAVKLVITGQQNQDISIAEIDVLGVTGDNVDFRKTNEEDTNVIGTLEEEYRYGKDEDDVIPAGSLVFTGSYKGNPAYSTVILYDNNGNVVGGVDENGAVKAQQIILADVPDGKNITEVTEGAWIYWIEPQHMKEIKLPESVRVELYRVNNAQTNEGYRLVSDTLFETLPEKLPTIMLNAE